MEITASSKPEWARIGKENVNFGSMTKILRSCTSRVNFPGQMYFSPGWFSKYQPRCRHQKVHEILFDAVTIVFNDVTWNII